MKGLIYLKFILFLLSNILTAQSQDLNSDLNNLIDNWHQAAAEADLKTYQSLMTKDAIFIGTDPTEYWQGREFIEFAKPYFDRGQAWTFHDIERHIYCNENKTMAWFDELLDTQMGICRGSGVLVLENKQWKIKHYVLSITIPNENVEEVKALKLEFDKGFIERRQP